ncbi:MAG: hypothetical protein IJ196_08195 [Prevotella sp.]|nr:hypothetical protein [Prevotella sp.]
MYPTVGAVQAGKLTVSGYRQHLYLLSKQTIATASGNRFPAVPLPSKPIVQHQTRRKTMEIYVLAAEIVLAVVGVMCLIRYNEHKA